MPIIIRFIIIILTHKLNTRLQPGGYSPTTESPMVSRGVKPPVYIKLMALTRSSELLTDRSLGLREGDIRSETAEAISTRFSKFLFFNLLPKI